LPGGRARGINADEMEGFAVRRSKWYAFLSPLAAAVVRAGVLLVISAAAASAQQLRGTVMEGGTEVPLEGAVLTVLAGEDALRGVTLSDEGGGFTLRVPAGETVRLRAQRLG